MKELKLITVQLANAWFSCIFDFTAVIVENNTAFNHLNWANTWYLVSFYSCWWSYCTRIVPLIIGTAISTSIHLAFNFMLQFLLEKVYVSKCIRPDRCIDAYESNSCSREPWFLKEFFTIILRYNCLEIDTDICVWVPSIAWFQKFISCSHVYVVHDEVYDFT